MGPIVSIISREQISHSELASLSPTRRSNRLNLPVATVSFVIKGAVAEMEHYHREHETPLSGKLRLDTLILAAADLKEMGCDAVLTHVFIPGRNAEAGKNAPVTVKIEDWISYLRIYKSPSEFDGKQLL